MFCNVFNVTTDNIESVYKICPKENALSNVRNSKNIGYIVSKPKYNMANCLKNLSFIQEVWGKVFIGVDINEYNSVKIGDVTCYIPYMAMSELLYFCKTHDLNTARKIPLQLAGLISDKNIESAINRKNTSAPHVHGLHTYKAKFFPRFVRSLIVSNIDHDKEDAIICDPFLGSGTTTVECAMMGLPSYGIDIDPLSCFIAKAKAKGLKTNPDELFNTLNFSIPLRQEVSHFTFPEVFRRKFEKWGTTNDMNLYISQINKELDTINSEKGDLKIFHKLALSDALTRKFNVRMLGTGSGRFSLEIAKTDLNSLININKTQLYRALSTTSLLKRIYNIRLSEPIIEQGDATQRKYEDSKFDIIVTSPPYLPAASGREDYLVGKMISLKAIGGLSETDFANYSNKSVGSIDNKDDIKTEGLPLKVIELYNWLKHDELRSIKALPVLSYYNALKKSLIEDKRTIRPTGKIIYIIGKESVFYKMSTGEVLYKVDCSSIFQELAQSVGLKIHSVIDIELDKKNVVARPRASDKYYETAIIMEK